MELNENRTSNACGECEMPSGCHRTFRLPPRSPIAPLLRSCRTQRAAQPGIAACFLPPLKLPSSLQQHMIPITPVCHLVSATHCSV